MVQNTGFSKNLKISRNVAIIANPEFGIDSLCAAVGLGELVKEFISQNDTSVSVFYPDVVPSSANTLLSQVKVHKKFGEKTLYFTFPSNRVSKVVYDYLENEKRFRVGLVGVDSNVVDFNKVEHRVTQEEYDMCVGVGYISESVFKEYLSKSKNCANYFVFNKQNLKKESLTEGVIDLYFNENVVPSRIASLSFFTYLGKKD